MREECIRVEKFAIEKITITTEKKMLPNEKLQNANMNQNYTQMENNLKTAREDMVGVQALIKEKDLKIEELFNKSLIKEIELQDLRKVEEMKVLSLLLCKRSSNSKVRIWLDNFKT